MKEKLLQEISKYTKATDNVVIEAAHIYADKQPCLEQQKGAVLATEVYSSLQIPALRTLLIDDYNASSKTLDVKAYLTWLANHGYSPDEVMMESDLVPAALGLLEELKDTLPARKFAIHKDEYGETNGALGLRTSVGRVPLLTIGGRPSCALLDASFYLKKSQQAPVCLTVLPAEYFPQQSATHAILGRFKKGITVVNLYFHPNNETESFLSTNQ